MKVETDERYGFACSPAELWPALTRVEDYRSWWPWLRRFDGSTFAAGERWLCTVKPPLPYRVRFALHLDEVVVGRWAVASLSGDIRGSARLDVAATTDGSELHLTAKLEPSSPLLQVLSVLGRPAVRLGHDWIIRTGLRQFEDQAL